jgi:hypothetical protein
MTTPPLTGRHARLRSKLSDRDVAVLSSLYQLRLLTSRQIQRLHLPDGSEITRSRRTRALMQRLTELGVVVRLGRTVGGVQPGSSAQVFGLSGLGLAVLDVQGPYGRRRRTVWETKPYFLHHVLAVADVCVGLTELSRDGTADLLIFDGEPAAWRRFAGSAGAPVTLKPDAYVRVGIGEFERSAFVELDMASESLPTIERKCLTYVGYWRSGAEQRQHEVFPLVMWLVPNEERQRKLREVIDRLVAEARHLFSVVLHGEGPNVLTAPLEAVV